MLFGKYTVNIIKNISPEDEMYMGNIDHYFNVGESAIICVALAIQESGKEYLDIKRILDLPCGHGRVLRFLKSAFPQASITACDLLHDGVDFCAQVFGAVPLYSDKYIKNVILKEKYDLIWCGSLLTHLNSDQWPLFIDYFNSALEPGGILLFTVHGRYPADILRNSENTYGLETPEKINYLVNEYDNTGFGFSNYFHSDNYGISLSSPKWVMQLLREQSNLQVLTYMEKGWDNHQDVIACIKR